MPYNTPRVMITAMMPKAMMVDRISDFKCLLMTLDVVLVEKIIKVGVLLRIDVGEGLEGVLLVPVGL